MVGRGVALDVWRWHSPVVAKGSAPDAEIEDLHKHEGKGDVASKDLYSEVFLQRYTTEPLDKQEPVIALGS